MEDELAAYAQKNAEEFWKDAGDNHLNRGFPLASGSKVIDVGGYLGDWAAHIAMKHDCWIDIYEPLKDYCASMRARFADKPKIRIFNQALEDHNGKTPIAFMNDSSSFYYPLRSDALEVPVTDVWKIMDGPVDLMSLNCEGSEYSILDRLISTGKIKDIKHLLIQFHTFVPNAKEKREQIIEQLWKTHQQRWCYPFVWESWSRLWSKEE